LDRAVILGPQPTRREYAMETPRVRVRAWPRQGFNLADFLFVFHGARVLVIGLLGVESVGVLCATTHRIIKT
jgi:hypothetical protein